jgi:hypothetical protein
MRRAFLIATVLAVLGLSAPATQALAKPVVKGSWPAAVGANTATLRAEIDPGGLATTYLFEYTTEAEYRVKGFIGATKIPQTQIAIGTGSVQQRLGGLQADTAYRFRVVATSDDTTVGKVRSLRTDEESSLFALPDNRGWELVSPVDKNGGEIQSFGGNRAGGVIQAAAQGGAITYTSASSFANAQGSPGPNQYLSTRGGSAWSTENITLPMLSGTYPEAPDSGVPYQLFSSDLAGGLVSNGRRCRTSASTQCPVENPPLPGSDAPAGYRNYYQRGGSGAFKALLSSANVASLALDSSHFELSFAGATADLAHVILSTCAALTPGATEVPGAAGECDPAKQNLYEKTGSTLTLINPAPGATLAAQSRAISANGSRVYWSDGANLYLYDAGATKQVDAVQGGGGTFETASTDGSVAFFTKGEHLYRYTAAGGAVTDLTPAGEVLGVLGASATPPTPSSPPRSTPRRRRPPSAMPASVPTATACSSSPTPNSAPAPMTTATSKPGSPSPRSTSSPPPVPPAPARSASPATPPASGRSAPPACPVPAPTAPARSPPTPTSRASSRPTPSTSSSTATTPSPCRTPTATATCISGRPRGPGAAPGRAAASI